MLTVYNICDVILKAISLLLSCMLKQVFLNICYMRYKVTGEGEEKHFQSVLNDVGFNNSHCCSYNSGCMSVLREPQIKP